MKTWAVRLAGALDIILGLVIAAANLSLVSREDDAGVTATAVWLGIGGVMAVTGVGVALLQGWARALGLLIALVYLLICAAFFARQGLNVEGANGSLKAGLVAATGLAQAFVFLILAVGWRAAKYRPAAS